MCVNTKRREYHIYVERKVQKLQIVWVSLRIHKAQNM